MSDSGFVRVIKRKEVLTLAFGAMIGWSWPDNVSRGWEKVDGQWYSTAMSCTSATGRQ